MRTPPHTSLILAAGCLAALALPASIPTADAFDVTDATPASSARTPAELARLLARWDRMHDGAARTALAERIDLVAGQRYATVSRLYWHTDLAAAKAAAAREHKPILSLRMLGRLDEELSCANSRLFRATLYANQRVATLLRERFVLHWSSERAVPRLTIDFGDGRKVETTTTGNSAHYVLDEHGAVLDVLPGVYAPVAFEAELTKLLALTARLDRLALDERPGALARYHREALAPLDAAWSRMAGTWYLPGARSLITRADVDSAIAAAQRATFAKAYIEVPALRTMEGLTPGNVSEDETALWATIGQKTWSLGLPPATAKAAKAPPAGTSSEGELAWVPIGGGRQVAPPLSTTAPRVLDARSRALVSRLHQAGPLHATSAELDRMILRLEQHLVADSALNEYRLRRQIHAHLAAQPNDFSSVNAWIYADLFHTPSGDAWLGLVPRTDFTGLPGDGVVTPGGA